MLDNERLSALFQSRPDILAGIHQNADSPARIILFNDIANFMYEQIGGNSDEPANKRRRVEVARPPTNGRAANGVQVGGELPETDPVLLEIKDISLSVPVRKKYDLVFTSNFLYARASGTSAPVPGIVYAWRDFEHIFYLPVPEKNQVQHNYVLFPRGSYLPTSKASTTQPASQAAIEPLVFTVPSTAPKPGTIKGPSAGAAAAASDSHTTLFDWALTTSLRTAGSSVPIVRSDARIFHSATRQPYRPTEKAVHVKAFRGSKDGYLFFLPTGILWGFKKPLLFLPLDRIQAVSYTSVLQRTFNLLIEVDVGGDKTEEIEFGMIDQEDYAGINEMYIARHGLQDRSMAEARKAKRELAENAKGSKGGEDGGDGQEDDGLTELERARLEEERRLQDEEDEEEEDYDPGSEGESEGSGTSDEESGGEEDAEGEEDEEDDMEGHE